MLLFAVCPPEKREKRRGTALMLQSSESEFHRIIQNRSAFEEFLQASDCESQRAHNENFTCSWNFCKLLRLDLPKSDPKTHYPEAEQETE
jgi:hypothetical protein